MTYSRASSSNRPKRVAIPPPRRPTTAAYRRPRSARAGAVIVLTPGNSGPLMTVLGRVTTEGDMTAMAEIDTQVLPLLPLTTGVVLPGMVVTLTIETDEAQAAVEAADGGELLLVPRIGERYARVGTVAKIEDVGRLRQRHSRRWSIRGLHRAAVGTGCPAPARPPGSRSSRSQTPRRPPSAPTAAGARVPGRRREHRGGARRPAGRRVPPRASTTPGQLADTAGYSPDLSFEQKVEVLETLDVEQRLEKVAGLGAGHARRARAQGARSAPTSPRAWRSASASSCCASR